MKLISRIDMGTQMVEDGCQIRQYRLGAEIMLVHQGKHDIQRSLRTDRKDPKHILHPSRPPLVSRSALLCFEYADKTSHTSPSILLNYFTAPDCCIFSAVLASAAVPGILNPVVLMTKTKHGTIIPFSFGHKWKDGSLRTDIPLRALNAQFNVTFSIVSQVNPHVNIFFFSSRGTVGRPVTHRKGKGWRGGFLGSALEQYLKLDMAKWLKVLRHLELLPRPLSQDWSGVFLQKFDGNITIWPKTVLSDFYYILSDPTPQRLERMLEVGQKCTFPKLKFVRNRLRIERLVDAGRQMTRGKAAELEPPPPPVQQPRRRRSVQDARPSSWFALWKEKPVPVVDGSASITEGNQDGVFPASEDWEEGVESTGSTTSDEEDDVEVIEKFVAAGT